MRKSCFIFLCINTFFVNVQAQYIFNGCNNRPAYNDSLTGIIFNFDSTSITSGNAGSSITWNYTNLTLSATGKISHSYYDPSTIKDTSSSSNLPLFPSANLADLAPNGVYSFYQFNSDSVTYLGDYIDVRNYQLVLGSEKQIICPFNFGNSFYNSFSLHPIGICTFNSYINRTITYDAYGTLNTPHASYSVARLKIVEQEIDTSCTPHIPPAFKADTTYMWFDINTGQPVFSWEYYNDTTTHYINKYVEEYSYSHLPLTVATSVLPVDEQLSGFNIYPNPTSGIFQITSNKIRIMNLEIDNVLGEKIYQCPISQLKSPIDISSHPSGIYFLKTTSQDGSSSVKKIIKE